ncbi:MAG: formylglycine-generating enzyme family protein [Candidatus Brocadiia bacterium]
MNLGLYLAASLAILCGAPWSLAKGGEEEVTNAIGMKFRLIPAGSFRMGSEAEGDEVPPHKVTITRPFYMGVTEVTQKHYEKVMAKNPSRFDGDDLPVENVSWFDATAFCEKLSEMDDSGSYRLPTEAEWEYACRAGTQTTYYWGDEFDGRYAWIDKEPDGPTNPVGKLRPNKWGLHDMSGNVWEWCQDWYAPNYMGAKQVDPTGPAKGKGRVLRGGSWYYNEDSCRSANRRTHPPERVDGDAGFRVVYVPAEK